MVEFQSHHLELLNFDQHKPEYLIVNPNGTILAMMHGDVVLAESTAIMEYVDEATKAIVVRAQDSTVTEQEVVAHCKTRLGGVKAPKSVDFWDEIPKTANNKMDKKAIRSKYWAGSERNVH